ncbi:hypothetical protein AFL01nite_05270 [Aeromicrobium flavum]|uniref:Uncharacterized protein n=1 Tax=Aeromicrobium flavum TaxID=416568 RepID=A0A512HS40_9ACTN|nr:hypothetical protein AFL01nite_05270 [Aeromicrobium flavum]
MAYITAGTAFDVPDITFWADARHRSLDEALAGADVLVSCPDATAAFPAELEPWVSPILTREDQEASATALSRLVARRWAAVDPTVVYVENPHPPAVSRPDPELLGAVDPDVLAEVASRGAGVYRATRLQLIQRLVLTRSSSPHRPLTSLTLRDVTMPAGQPAVLSLANRGDLAGNPRPKDPLVTMDPERLRLLADSHRTGFGVRSHDEVALNTPHRDDDEIVETAERFGRGPEAVDAVRLDLSRQLPTDPDAIDEVARRLRRSWVHYRTTVG